jgi:hypothetical protein
MLTYRGTLTALAAVLLSSLFGVVATAQAAPITVNLRVEGSTKTDFEGPVSVEAIAKLSTPETEGKAFPCNVADNGSNGGFVAEGATPTDALYDAAQGAGLSFNASWSSEFNDFLVTQVGSDVNLNKEPYDAWGYAVNYSTANVGGCQFQLAPGAEVLWGYNYFNLSHLLSLSGPSTANAGTPFTVKVTEGRTGEPIAGAAIGEMVEGVTTTIPASATTNAAGEATIALSRTGTVRLKATQAESVRSNGLSVCVHSGNDGTCGTTIPIVLPSALGPATQYAPAAVSVVARAAGVLNGHTYPARRAPRLLKGLVTVPAGGTLRKVRLRLERRIKHRCYAFSGAAERFVRARCGSARFFSVGEVESFSYLLPSRLPAGRYTFDIEAIEDSGRVVAPVPGVGHVVFRVL